MILQDISAFIPTNDILALFSPEELLQYQIFPIKLENGILTLAIQELNDFDLLNQLTQRTHFLINPILTSPEQIQDLHQRYFRKSKSSPNLVSVNSSVKTPHISASPQSPAIKIVEDIFQEAARERATDIHFEPTAQGITIRLRQEGELRVYRNIALQWKNEVISRIKILAELDISEKRKPQDGRLQIMQASHKIDVRVSLLPTQHGEKIVLRLLDTSSVSLNLESLGMNAEQFDILNKYIHSPYGLVLITGPTGSGKTTTLYASLKTIHKPELNISTIEDPIEYKLDGINQTQIHEKIGVTFAQTLRTLLRQDPNVILVGEIRDSETADLTLRAAMTGHLVFSTLHTNDAPSSIARLYDIGIEPFLTATSLSLVVAQRLVRKSCPYCQEEYTPSAHLLHAFDLPTESLFLRSTGCSECNQNGYDGRIAIYEMMPMSENLRRLVQENASIAQIKEVAVSEGMKTLKDDGLAKAKLGLTTLEEVFKEVQV